MKRCRYCNKQIRDDAAACPFCRKSLSAAGPMRPPFEEQASAPESLTRHRNEDQEAPSVSPPGTSNGWIIGVLVVAATWWYQSQSVNHTPRGNPVASARQGDLAKRGGTATVRKPFVQSFDDPSTSNDEANDQPVGHFGTVTLSVCSLKSGNCYTLDGEMSGTALERIYFPKGGWVDFLSCELDDDLKGACDDEEGRSWLLEGEP